MDERIKLSMQDALLITDMQLDFLPGGALPVANGDQILPVINEYIKRFTIAKAPIIASRDWHPANHMSFKEQGGLWPPHCIQDTKGAQFSPDLKLPQNVLVISKATDPKFEAYSAFDHTNLDNELQNLAVRRLFVCGLATDYCVINTVFDAAKLGYETFVLMDAIMGIDVTKGDVNRAIDVMASEGINQITDDNFSEDEENLSTMKLEDDILAAKPSLIIDAKKKARLRPKTAKRRLKTEK